MIGILERGLGTHGERLIDPLSYALASHLQRPRNARDRFTGVIVAQDPRTLYFPQRRCARLAQLLQLRHLPGIQGQLRKSRLTCHASA